MCWNQFAIYLNKWKLRTQIILNVFEIRKTILDSLKKNAVEWLGRKSLIQTKYKFLHNSCSKNNFHDSGNEKKRNLFFEIRKKFRKKTKENKFYVSKFTETIWFFEKHVRSRKVHTKIKTLNRNTYINDVLFANSSL